jgi:hypothetical protein
MALKIYCLIPLFYYIDISILVGLVSSPLGESRGSWMCISIFIEPQKTVTLVRSCLIFSLQEKTSSHLTLEYLHEQQQC